MNSFALTFDGAVNGPFDFLCRKWYIIFCLNCRNENKREEAANVL